MASIGEIKADYVNESLKSLTQDRPHLIYFGIFFDGTGNNMIQPARAKSLKKRLDKCGESLNKDQLLEAHQELNLSSNGANSIDENLVADSDNDFSNIAALHSAYIGLSQAQRAKKEEKYNVHVFNIYVQGAGTNEVWTQTSDLFGSGFGIGRTGVAALVTKAIRLVDTVVKGLVCNSDLDNQICFDVFGFSRGATCARMFAHYVNGDLDLTRSYPDLLKLKKSYLLQFKKERRKVSFLGIYDTVSSIGINYDNNNIEYGLYSPNENWVEHTFHICALDEFRDHFRLTDVGNSVNRNALEIFLPGCHSDIGGGYKKGIEHMRIRYALSTSMDSPDKKDGPISVTNKGKILNYETIKDNIILHKKDPGIFQRNNQPEKTLIKIYKTATTNSPESISIEFLNELGWFDNTNPNYSYWDDPLNNIFNITRSLDRGYSNITLLLMQDKANKLTNRDMFLENNESRFSLIADDLTNFVRQIKSVAGGTIKSGKFVITPKKYEEYRKIRAKYLHFSACDSLIMAGKKTSIVNSPTLENNTINRIVYKGDINVSSSYFLNPSR